MASLENDSPSGIENFFFPGTIWHFVKRFSNHRETLGLQYPGTIENLSKEVQRDVFLTNHMFSGVRADLAKTFSVSPIFQVAHAFAQGSQNLPPYAFLASFGTPKLYLQGNTDNEGSVLARANYKWTDWWTTKTQSQLSPSNSQFMMQMDQDFIGKDFSASIKTINPSVLDGGVTGVFMGSYLQSVTPGLALGLEAMWSRASMQMGPESTVSYVARYRGSDWIATAQFAGLGTLNTSYWRRLTERVEVGSDLALQLQPDLSGRNGSFGGLQKQGNATLGAKYNFRTSIFRAQIDSTGKLGVLLDKFIFPTVQVTFAGEIDHLKQSAKVGVGVSVEIQSEDVIQSAENTTIVPPV